MEGEVRVCVRARVKFRQLLQAMTCHDLILSVCALVHSNIQRVLRCVCSYLLPSITHSLTHKQHAIMDEQT